MRPPTTHALVETVPARWAKAVCRCGEESLHEMPSYTGRERWMRAHRCEVAGKRAA